MYLFLDTTTNITLGLLNKDFKWLSYERVISKKGSALLHTMVNDLLSEHDKKILDIDGIIQIAGPGSYTGMRVSEGFSQVLEWQNIRIYSVYHFEIPEIVGVSSGVWFSRAFKGEIFTYKWKNEKQKKELVKENDFVNNIERENLYSNLNEYTDVQFMNTEDLIYENPFTILNYILKNSIKRELYYYREIEDEFTRSIK